MCGTWLGTVHARYLDGCMAREQDGQVTTYLEGRKKRLRSAYCKGVAPQRKGGCSSDERYNTS